MAREVEIGLDWDEGGNEVSDGRHEAAEDEREGEDGAVDGVSSFMAGGKHDSTFHGSSCEE